MTNIVFVFKTLIEIKLTFKHYYDYGSYFKCTSQVEFVFKSRYIIVSGFIEMDINC